MSLVKITRELAKKVDRLEFEAPVTHVYNPLRYARAPHEAYLERYGYRTRRVVLLGMNPGPFGMAQTGIPFGDVTLVREFLGIEGVVKKPKREHEKRRVEGFACARSEVSGTRFWGWARDRFGTADAFFERFFVINYCPLAFMEESGRNRTPDRLPKGEREPLYAACDAALARMLDVLAPKAVIGIGAFGAKRAQAVLGDAPGIKVGWILHPSPASPAANRGWEQRAEADLKTLGVRIPKRR
jgi:single-strand selective monofunctional uracil DNA glycosylase